MNSEVTAPPPSAEPGHWARALEGDGAALETLAGNYWYPAYVWLRVAGNDSPDTAMHVMSFFARLQTVEPPKTDEASATRFREFLLSRLKEFVFQGCPPSESMPTVLMDIATAERRFKHEPARPEDELFARRWSLTVLEHTMLRLRAEYEREEKSALFGALKPFLSFSKSDEAGYAEAALALDMSASAFHLAAYNFRIRYREMLRRIISDTVRTAEDVDSELTVLLVGAS